MRNSSAAVATIVISLISGPTLRGQATETQPHFEAADVHISPPATNPYTYAAGGVLRGGRYDLRKATMLDLIKTAWNVDPDIVFGGPNWLELDRFDISAKAPANTSPETVRLMLQALLRDRFGLIIHPDTRPLPAFALTAGKSKPKLTESNGSGNTGCEHQPSQAFAIYVCRNITMDAFAQTLKQLAGAYLPVPVMNETGLEGAWDFDVQWNTRSQVLQPDTNRITIFDAVDQQLGLKLVPNTTPGQVLVVERVNEKPTPNLPDIEKLLPPRPVEFEVADMKLSRPGEPPFFRVTPGRLEARGSAMPGLIGYGFDIDFDHVSELVANLPKSVEKLHLDINGKLPVQSVGKGDTWADDDVRLMVRSLLIDRFKIKYHYEDRTLPAYSLISAKPKMKEADPSHRSGCKEARSVANDPRDANPRLNRLVACQNVTMAQFAALLQGFAAGYLPVPVEDATNIKGAWDFTISFSGLYLLTNQAPGDGTSPSDPNGAVSLQDAISKQLGLKLEKRPRPVPILVIDHMEEKPAEN